MKTVTAITAAASFLAVACVVLFEVVVLGRKASEIEPEL